MTLLHSIPLEGKSRPALSDIEKLAAIYLVNSGYKLRVTKNAKGDNVIQYRDTWTKRWRGFPPASLGVYARYATENKMRVTSFRWEMVGLK